MVQPEGSTSARSSGGMAGKQDGDKDERVLDERTDGYLHTTPSSLNPAQMARLGTIVRKSGHTAVQDLPRGTGPFR